VIDKDVQMIIIKNFIDVNKALKYLVKLRKEDVMFDELKIARKESFVITNENLNLFRNHKNVDKYIEFFNKKY
jgi:hypothetical protein